MNPLESIQATIADPLDMLNARIHEALMSTNALMNKVVDGYLKTKG